MNPCKVKSVSSQSLCHSVPFSFGLRVYSHDIPASRFKSSQASGMVRSNEPALAHQRRSRDERSLGGHVVHQAGCLPVWHGKWNNDNVVTANIEEADIRSCLSGESQVEQRPLTDRACRGGSQQVESQTR